MAIFHLGVALTGPPEELVFRPLHLAFAMTLIFLMRPLGKGWPARVMLDGVPLALSLACLGYILFNQDYLTNVRIQYVDPPTTTEMWLGCTLVVLVLEASRRVIGLALPITAALFLGHALLGPWLPFGLEHDGYLLEEVVEELYLTTNGI